MGSSGEQWSPAQGLESVLLSIQSLLSTNPYLNEPGFENSDGERHEAHIELYKAKVSPLPFCVGRNRPETDIDDTRYATKT